MRFNYLPWIMAITIFFLGCFFAGCEKRSPSVLQAEYPTKLVGNWEGTAGSVKESMFINNDGSFICKLFPTGFIANTLFQAGGVTDVIHGKWKINGETITLIITSAGNEQLKNKTTSSTIKTLTNYELVLKSDGGEVSSFHRISFP